jgi:hypothetical protein
MADEGYGEDDAFYFDDDDYLYVEDDYAIAVSLSLHSPLKLKDASPQPRPETTYTPRRSREAACRTYPSEPNTSHKKEGSPHISPKERDYATERLN